MPLCDRPLLRAAVAAEHTLTELRVHLCARPVPNEATCAACMRAVTVSDGTQRGWCCPPKEPLPTLWAWQL